MPYTLAAVDELSETFATALPQGWDVAIKARERFGSWEWHASRWPDRRSPRQWAILAVTPTEAAADSATRAVIETWAAAEIRTRFTRRLVAAVEMPLVPDGERERRTVVSMEVAMAVNQAGALRPADIQTTYEPLHMVDARSPSEASRAEDVPERLGVAEVSTVELDWLGPLRGRTEVSVEEAATILGRSVAVVLERALIDVRAGRLRVQQRGRELYLVRDSPELAQ